MKIAEFFPEDHFRAFRRYCLEKGFINMSDLTGSFFKILSAEDEFSNEEIKEITDRLQEFDQNNSINSLSTYVDEFSTWLERAVVVEKVWLPSIDLEINLSIKRVEFIKICGNISKHNFSRLSGVAKELQIIFERNNATLDDDEALVIIDEFYEWFHDDIFSYHSSAIAEFLNNIRWGIYEYLQPEHQRSIVATDGHPIKYRYTYPDKVRKKFAQTCYWGLMNEIRSRPYMEKFQVTKYLKMRY